MPSLPSTLPTRPDDPPVVVIGAGPAGLTAAYELTQRGVPVVVFDRDCRVGGLAQTVTYNGCRFDIGGHRFFTKSRLVRDLWRDMLGSDFLRRSRLSRVYYRGKFFPYPLRALDTLRNLGVVESFAVLGSYLRAKTSPIRPEVSFEDWITNRFGRRLYTMFFKSYTEKVWGLPCDQISAQWAAQRIKGLSLRSAVVNMLLGERRRDRIKTLIGEFDYPRFGPGMMWDAFRDRVLAAGGRIEMETDVVALRHDGRRITGVVTTGKQGCAMHPASHVISTMAVRDLVGAFDPAMNGRVADAARQLQYRDFITVALVINRPSLFPDNWIYVHDPSVRVGRIQNFKNWSPDMVPNASVTCLGLEYFCTEGDDLWSKSDAELLDLGRIELQRIGLAQAATVVDGTVVRMRKAYPVYDSRYGQALAVIREQIDRFENLQLIGRNGTHTYNNQDHSMLSAILAVRNLYGEQHDLWQVNADADYHEELTDEELAAQSNDGTVASGRARTQPLAPLRIEKDIKGNNMKGSKGFEGQ